MVYIHWVSFVLRRLFAGHLPDSRVRASPYPRVRQSDRCEWSWLLIRVGYDDKVLCDHEQGRKLVWVSVEF